jgi:hypothetical protein
MKKLLTRKVSRKEFRVATIYYLKYLTEAEDMKR